MWGPLPTGIPVGSTHGTTYHWYLTYCGTHWLDVPTVHAIGPTVPTYSSKSTQPILQPYVSICILYLRQVLFKI